jgi:hypothetical protein
VGLTIHYKLHSDARSPVEARRLVEELRRRALDLPFAEAEEVVELAGDACDFEKQDREHPHRWLLIQAGGWLVHDDVHYRVKPKHVIAFGTDPGEDCEQANFGLCLYPGVLEVTDPTTGNVRKLRTQLKGWCWSSFCKSQYASRHGLDHFLRCHLCVIPLLDHAKQFGILASVNDEGDFWEKRDVKALAKEVGEWNENMAGLVGQLKDMFGGGFDAPITQYPDFEHLEAKGRRKRKK